MNKSLYVVGDIHGMLEALKETMRKIEEMVTEKSVVCFLGDYIDRGPDSWGVVDFLINYSHPLIEPVFLKGNHEDMLLQGIEKKIYWKEWMKNGGRETMDSYQNAGQWPISESHIEFYKSLKLYYQHYMNGKSIVCVHAGLHPMYDLKDQLESEMLWIRKFVDYRGSYKGNHFVIYGHTPNHVPFIQDNSLGIDTGAVFGNKLTTAIFKMVADKEVNCSLFSVSTNEHEYYGKKKDENSVS